MSNSVNDKQFEAAKKLIDKVVEPKLQEIINTFNEHLKAKIGIVVIGKIEWEFHSVQSEEVPNANTEEDSK